MQSAVVGPAHAPSPPTSASCPGCVSQQAAGTGRAWALGRGVRAEILKQKRSAPRPVPDRPGSTAAERWLARAVGTGRLSGRLRPSTSNLVRPSSRRASRALQKASRVEHPYTTRSLGLRFNGRRATPSRNGRALPTSSAQRFEDQSALDWSGCDDGVKKSRTTSASGSAASVWLMNAHASRRSSIDFSILARGSRTWSTRSRDKATDT